MDRLYRQIEAYQPRNEQEARDKAQMLAFLRQNEPALLRENLTAHFTASAWVVDRARAKTLMVYHNLYDSWSWIGGHADGEADLCAVARRELWEETGLADAVLAQEGIFSLETLTVNGHVRKGQYVPSHLHFNLTYLFEADEAAPLRARPEENQAVRWFRFEDALAASTEPWMVERVYRKLVGRSRAMPGA